MRKKSSFIMILVFIMQILALEVFCSQNIQQSGASVTFSNVGNNDVPVVVTSGDGTQVYSTFRDLTNSVIVTTSAHSGIAYNSLNLGTSIIDPLAQPMIATDNFGQYVYDIFVEASTNDIVVYTSTNKGLSFNKTFSTTDSESGKEFQIRTSDDGKYTTALWINQTTNEVDVIGSHDFGSSFFVSSSFTESDVAHVEMFASSDGKNVFITIIKDDANRTLLFLYSNDYGITYNYSDPNPLAIKAKVDNVISRTGGAGNQKVGILWTYQNGTETQYLSIADDVESTFSTEPINSSVNIINFVLTDVFKSTDNAESVRIIPAIEYNTTAKKLYPLQLILTDSVYEVVQYSDILETAIEREPYDDADPKVTMQVNGEQVSIAYVDKNGDAILWLSTDNGQTYQQSDLGPPDDADRIILIDHDHLYNWSLVLPGTIAITRKFRSTFFPIKKMGLK